MGFLFIIGMALMAIKTVETCLRKKRKVAKLKSKKRILIIDDVNRMN